MVNFLLLMLIPIIIALISVLSFKKKVTLQEFGLQLAVPAMCMFIGLCFAYFQSTTDTEIWNGRVTAKKSERVGCRHSYSCNCVTTCSGEKNETCSTVCQTCYEHSYDMDWNIYASTGESVTISTIDRQGLQMPPRWGIAFIGEPYSSAHYYTNYILANPESVLLGGKGDVKKWASLLPGYPNVYDYYRTVHFLNLSVPFQSDRDWKWLLDEINGDLGPSKQVQVLLLLIPTDDPSYMLALKDTWLGGKKNDAVIVIGSKDGHKIGFVDVLSWTPSAKYKVLLKDAIYATGSLDKRDQIATAIRLYTATYFQRMHMKDYQYLMKSFQPSQTAMLVLFFIGTLGSIGLAAFTITNDITDDEGRNYSRYNGRY